MKINLSIIYLVFIFGQSALAAYTPNHNNDPKCAVERVVFYISTKSIYGKHALVNKCTNKLGEIISKKSIPINFEFAMSSSFPGKKVVPQYFVYDLIFKLFEIKDFLNVDCSQIRCLGFVDPAISPAYNIDSFISYISKSQKYEVKKMNHSDLANISFFGVYATNDLKYEERNKLIILEISDDYFQANFLLKNEIQHKLVNYGPAKLKEKIYNIIQSYKMTKVKFINPVTYIQLDTAKNFSINELKTKLFSDLSFAGVVNPGNKIYISGSFIDNTITKLFAKDKGITIISLLNLMTKIIGLNDKEVKDAFPDIANFSNVLPIDLVFLFSIMRAADVEKVFPLSEFNILDGAMVTSKYWD